MTITTPARDKIDKALRAAGHTFEDTLRMLDDLHQEVRDNDAKTTDSDGWQYLRDVLAHMQQGGKLSSVEATVTEAVQRIGRQQLPRRDDAVEAWLKAQRDACFGHASTYNVIDGLLDEYRLHADTRTPLHEHVCEAGNIHDCAGCHDAQEASRARS